MCKKCAKLKVIIVSSQWSEKPDFPVHVATFPSEPGSQKSIQMG